jgi:hypothetical protein
MSQSAPAVSLVTCEARQRIEHVGGAHLVQSAEQRARVFEHDPRLEPFVEELRGEFVTPQKDARCGCRRCPDCPASTASCSSSVPFATHDPLVLATY